MSTSRYNNKYNQEIASDIALEDINKTFKRIEDDKKEEENFNNEMHKARINLSLELTQISNNSSTLFTNTTNNNTPKKYNKVTLKNKQDLDDLVTHVKTLLLNNNLQEVHEILSKRDIKAFLRGRSFYFYDATEYQLSESQLIDLLEHFLSTKDIGVINLFCNKNTYIQDALSNLVGKNETKALTILSKACELTPNEKELKFVRDLLIYLKNDIRLLSIIYIHEYNKNKSHNALFQKVIYNGVQPEQIEMFLYYLSINNVVIDTNTSNTPRPRR